MFESVFIFLISLLFFLVVTPITYQSDINQLSYRVAEKGLVPIVFSVPSALVATYLTQSGLGYTVIFSQLVLLSLIVAIIVVDYKTQYIPNSLSYLLIATGLLFSLLSINEINIGMSITGFILGYMSLWTLFHVALRVTGKECMGYGDFKMLAGLGAWFGPLSLIGLVLIASILSLIVSLYRGNGHKPMAYGPYLGIAGIAFLMFGEKADYLYWLGKLS